MVPAYIVISASWSASLLWASLLPALLIPHCLLGSIHIPVLLAFTWLWDFAHAISSYCKALISRSVPRCPVKSLLALTALPILSVLHADKSIKDSCEGVLTLFPALLCFPLDYKPLEGKEDISNIYYRKDIGYTMKFSFINWLVLPKHLMSSNKNNFLMYFWRHTRKSMTSMESKQWKGIEDGEMIQSVKFLMCKIRICIWIPQNQERKKEAVVCIL